MTLVAKFKYQSEPNSQNQGPKIILSLKIYCTRRRKIKKKKDSNNGVSPRRPVRVLSVWCEEEAFDRNSNPLRSNKIRARGSKGTSSMTDG